MSFLSVINGGASEGASPWTERDHFQAGKIVGNAIQLRAALRTGRHSLPLPEAERESLILALSRFIEAADAPW